MQTVEVEVCNYPRSNYTNVRSRSMQLSELNVRKYRISHYENIRGLTDKCRGPSMQQGLGMYMYTF